MKMIKGYRLYIRLSPSQTRRRLRGHGHGVRKVESAGTGRALIIHTATGNHLRELEGLFMDVLEPAAEPAALDLPEGLPHSSVDEERPDSSLDVEP